MKSLYLKATEDTPTVRLDADNGIFELAGRSLMDDATAFYNPIIHWLRVYAQKPNQETVFHFKMEWFNTPSSKLILDVLMQLRKIPHAKVVWYHHDDVDEEDDIGMEFAEIVEIPFEFRVFI